MLFQPPASRHVYSGPYRLIDLASFFEHTLPDVALVMNAGCAGGPSVCAEGYCKGPRTSDVDQDLYIKQTKEKTNNNSNGQQKSIKNKVKY